MTGLNSHTCPRQESGSVSTSARPTLSRSSAGRTGAAGPCSSTARRSCPRPSTPSPTARPVRSARWSSAGTPCTARGSTQPASSPTPSAASTTGRCLLGDRELPVGELMAAVLRRVRDEWRRTVGGVDPDVTLTFPASWGATRRLVLADAAATAGLGQVRLVPEPVAAAAYFTQVLGREVPIGAVVVVHDFGAGTFDASVVVPDRRPASRCWPLTGATTSAASTSTTRSWPRSAKCARSRDPAAWQRLMHPETVEDRRARRLLWDDARVAKERLSRTPAADLTVPLLNADVHFTRQELEQLARPLIEQTIRVTQGVIRWAQLAKGRIAGVFLVGGSSRIPLVATMLHQALGEAPVAIEQPELVVAEGSVVGEAASIPVTPARPRARRPAPIPTVPPITPEGGFSLPSAGSRTGPPGNGTPYRPTTPRRTGVRPAAVGSQRLGVRPTGHRAARLRPAQPRLRPGVRLRQRLRPAPGQQPTGEHAAGQRPADQRYRRSARRRSTTPPVNPAAASTRCQPISPATPYPQPQYQVAAASTSRSRNTNLSTSSRSSHSRPATARSATADRADPADGPIAGIPAAAAAGLRRRRPGPAEPVRPRGRRAEAGPRRSSRSWWSCCSSRCRWSPGTSPTTCRPANGRRRSTAGSRAKS